MPQAPSSPSTLLCRCRILSRRPEYILCVQGELAHGLLQKTYVKKVTVFNRGYSYIGQVLQLQCMYLCIYACNSHTAYLLMYYVLSAKNARMHLSMTVV